MERAPTDERNFVKKGVNWALRRIGRRNAIALSPLRTVPAAGGINAGTARWIGKDALRELTIASGDRLLPRFIGLAKLKDSPTPKMMIGTDANASCAMIDCAYGCEEKSKKRRKQRRRKRCPASE